jgi:hypothetical protein
MSTPTTDTMSTPYQPGHSSFQQLQQSQWADDTCPPPISRSIAINTRDRCAEDLTSSQDEATCELMYDWATWRMYNRIVDHRRNQKISASSYLPSPVEQPEQYMASASNHLPSPDYVHVEQDIFELDI